MTRRRGTQDVRIFSIQDRTSRREATQPWVVRWRVDRRTPSRAFHTKPEADRFRSRLLVAKQDGERFDARTGLPESWLPPGRRHPGARVGTTVGRRAVARMGPTHPAGAHILVGEVPTPRHGFPSDGAAGRPAVVPLPTLAPDADIDERDECEKWLARWALTLGDLDRDNLAVASHELGVGDEGQQLAAETVRRYRRTAHSCIRRAVELDQIPADPWPPTPRGRSRRKANRIRKAVDVRHLPGPTSAAAIITALRSHQRGSRNYQMMSAVVYYAGLRPSETAMLRPRALHLPAEGWGRIDVVEADDGWDEPAEPKTGDRTVPIPPKLVELLQSWVTEHELGPDDLLFRTRGDRRPSQSNWARALGRACKKAGHRRIRV